MHASIAMAGLVSGASALELSTESYTFEKFCSNYGRHGVTAEQIATRKANFDRNLAEVVAHNADKKQLYKRTINRFSDWSDEELQKFNSLKFDGKSTLLKGHSIYNGTVGKPAPKTLDYRTGNVLTPVYDQGSCGSCWAFSTVQSVESAFALKYLQGTYQDNTPLSVSQVVECDTEELKCNGGWPLEAMNWIAKSKGLVTALEYPYADGTGIPGECQDTSSKKTSATVTKAFQVKLNDAKATIDALVNKGPLSIAIACNGAFQSYDSGIFEMQSGDSWHLNHAVQLVGYGVDASLNNQEYWIVRNSWATSWGDAGFIRMWKAGKDQKEPCGTDPSNPGNTLCGTLGLLFVPTYVEVGKGE